MLEVVLELRQTALGHSDIQIFVKLVEYGMVLFIKLVFLLEWYVTDGLVLFYKFLYALLQVFTLFLGNGLEAGNDVAFLLQILALLAMLVGSCGIAGIEEFVAGSKELFP